MGRRSGRQRFHPSVTKFCTNVSAASAAMYAALRVGHRLSGKDHVNLQKAPDLFNKYAEINGNTVAAHSGSREAERGFPLALGSPRRAQLPETLHLEGPASMKYSQVFALQQSFKTWGMQHQSRV